MDQSRGHESNAAENRKSSIGVVMTIIYSVIYGGFVFLSVFYPTLMGGQIFLGMNLAVTYGLGLIVIAIILAMIYNQMVRTKTGVKRPENALTPDQSELEK